MQPQTYGTLERSRYDSVGSSTSNSGEEPNSQTLSRRGSMKKKKFLYLIDGHRQSDNLMKESNVFANDDGKTWDWEIISTIFSKVNKNGNISLRNFLSNFFTNNFRQMQPTNWILNLYDFCDVWCIFLSRAAIVFLIKMLAWVV